MKNVPENIPIYRDNYMTRVVVHLIIQDWRLSTLFHPPDKVSQATKEPGKKQPPGE